MTLTYGNNTQQNFSFVYDRWGNLWQKNAPQGGPSVNFTYNTMTNHNVQLSYDAAGNVVNDAVGNTYQYDAEGKVLAIGGNTTASYGYDALNHRVRAQTASATEEYTFDYAGRRTGTWRASTNIGTEGRIYWGDRQIAFRAYDGKTYFDHQDWLGSERMRTSWNGANANTYVSLPFGDGNAAYAPTAYSNQDTLGFAGLDNDSPVADHAQFREYSNIQGRWMSPDPYDGSMDLGNPQSLNRYSYVGNNPLRFRDPSGLDAECFAAQIAGGPIGTFSCHLTTLITTAVCGPVCGLVFGTLAAAVADLTYELLVPHHPKLTASPDPRPSVRQCIGTNCGKPDPTSNDAVSDKRSFLDKWPFNGNLFQLTPLPQDQLCTTGYASGPMNSNLAVLSCCQEHDDCYAANGCNATSWIPNPLPWGACNACNAKAAACVTGALFK